MLSERKKKRKNKEIILQKQTKILSVLFFKFIQRHLSNTKKKEGKHEIKRLLRSHCFLEQRSEIDEIIGICFVFQKNI
jgi:hypothetical protein